MEEKKKKVIIVNEDGTTDEKAMMREEAKDFLHNAAETGKGLLKEAWKFTTENKENLMFVIGLGGAAATVLKKLNNGGQSDDRYRTDNSVYDPVTHTRFWLRRSMTNSERVEYVRRVRNGEYTDEVLESMGLLRR